MGLVIFEQLWLMSIFTINLSYASVVILFFNYCAGRLWVHLLCGFWCTPANSGDKKRGFICALVCVGDDSLVHAPWAATLYKSWQFEEQPHIQSALNWELIKLRRSRYHHFMAHLCLKDIGVPCCYLQWRTLHEVTISIQLCQIKYQSFMSALTQTH